jgi:nucleotide-binding universal stress UspA family protein
LLATGGSEYSVAAERAIASRPWPVGTVFKILSVEELVPMPIPVEVSSLAAIYPASLLGQLLPAARARAVAASEGAGKMLTQAGLTVLAQASNPSGDPRSVILDTAKTWQADLIVLGSHGRHGLDRLLMGSVAESVAFGAPRVPRTARDNTLGARTLQQGRSVARFSSRYAVRLVERSRRTRKLRRKLGTRQVVSGERLPLPHLGRATDSCH